MHPRAVVADDGLRHEGRGLAVRARDIEHRVLEDLQPVGALHQGIEFRADLVLPRGRHLVVVHLDFHALFLERERDRGADVLQRIDRGHREVAALQRRTVAEVAALELEVGGPWRLFRVDLHRAARHVDLPLDGVEDEELRLRTEVGDVSQAARLEVRLGFLRDRARIALVALARRRLDHVAGDRKRRLVVEGIHTHGIRIGHEQHVRSLDAFPTRDRGAVEEVAVLELVVVERLHGNGNVLFLAFGVGKPKIDELDLVFLDCLEDIRNCHRFSPDVGVVPENGERAR